MDQAVLHVGSQIAHQVPAAVQQRHDAKDTGETADDLSPSRAVGLWAYSHVRDILTNPKHSARTILLERVNAFLFDHVFGEYPRRLLDATLRHLDATVAQEQEQQVTGVRWAIAAANC